jgi:replicative DNA helicase
MTGLHTATPVETHQDLLSEQALLGCLMLDDSTFPEITRTVVVDDFASLRHAVVYAAMLAQRHEGLPVELPAVVSRLIDIGDIGRAGGAAYLHECVTTANRPGTAMYYAQRVREVAARRRMAELVTRTASITREPRPAAETYDRLKQALEAAAPRADSEDEFSNLSAMVEDAFRRIEQAPHVASDRIKTGFPDLDAFVRIKPQQLVVVGARPGHGKSLLTLDIARHAAYQQHLRVGLISMEMSKQEVLQRVLSAESGVLHDSIDTGALNDTDWSKLARAANRMAEGVLLVSERSGLTLPEVQARAELLVKDHGMQLLVLDYLQLVKGPAGRQVQSRQQEIGEVTRGLKALAARLNITVLAAAQLNRESDKRGDKRPQMSDLREAGDIENDANIVVLIHNLSKADPEGPRSGEADLIVVKNRGGSDGVVTVAAQFNRARFESFAFDRQDGL